MMNILEETFETIEINDLQALFTNSRINRNSLPEGTFAYDIRESDDGETFATIEKQVIVNHAVQLSPDKKFR